jgi:hypothetical protein
MHLSSTSEGSKRLARRLRLVTRRCSRKLWTKLRTDKGQERRRLPPTRKSLEKCIRVSKSLPDIAKASGIPLKDHEDHLQSRARCVENRASSGSLSTSVGVREGAQFRT